MVDWGDRESVRAAFNKQHAAFELLQDEFRKQTGVVVQLRKDLAQVITDGAAANAEINRLTAENAQLRIHLPNSGKRKRLTTELPPIGMMVRFRWMIPIDGKTMMD